MSTQDTSIPRQVIQRLYVLQRTVLSHGVDHKLVVTGIDALIELLDRQRVELQFVQGAMFRDQQMVTLNWDELVSMQEVSRALNHLGFQELALGPSLESSDVITLARALARGSQGPYPDADALKFKTIAWRHIPHATWGEDQEDIDQGMYALSQMALAVRDAEQLRQSEAWNWGEGLGIVRRIERAVCAHFPFASHALELGETSWSAARQAVAVAFDVFATMNLAGIELNIIRIATHVALGVSMAGLSSEGEDLLVADAAKAFLDRALAQTFSTTTGMPPHQLRVASATHLFTSEDTTRWFSFMHLIHMCYELEGERCPQGLGFSLTKADLLVIATEEMGSHYPADWVRLLVSLWGESPAGAYVRLADGRVGISAGRITEDEDIIQVFIQGRVENVRPPLQLISAAEAHGLLS